MPETEPMGRGGGLRLATQARQETGPLYVLNGDELIDVDLSALLAAHQGHGAAATIVVAPLPTAFGVVDIEDDDRVAGFQDSPELPFWAHAGVNVFDDEALARLPGEGRSRVDDAARIGRGGQALRVSPLRPLADGQHP